MPARQRSNRLTKAQLGFAHPARSNHEPRESLLASNKFEGFVGVSKSDLGPTPAIPCNRRLNQIWKKRTRKFRSIVNGCEPLLRYRASLESIPAGPTNCRCTRWRYNAGPDALVDQKRLQNRPLRPSVPAGARLASKRWRMIRRQFQLRRSVRNRSGVTLQPRSL